MSIVNISTTDPRKPATVHCADGTVVEIKPGRTKSFVMRKHDNRLHLLDCPCEACIEARATAKAESAP